MDGASAGTACPVVRPQEAPAVLADLMESDDEDVVEAAFEALAMSEGPSGDDERLH